MNLLCVCRRDFPVSDGVRPSLLVRRHVSCQVQSTWLYSSPLSKAMCFLASGSMGTQRDSRAVLLTSTPNLAQVCMPQAHPCPHVHNACAASFRWLHRYSDSSFVCLLLSAEFPWCLQRKPNSAFFCKAWGGA